MHRQTVKRAEVRSTAGTALLRGELMDGPCASRRRQAQGKVEFQHSSALGQFCAEFTSLLDRYYGPSPSPRSLLSLFLYYNNVARHTC